jgi:glutamate racemase
LLTQPGAERIDSIALGCTHYTFLLPELAALRPNIKWFDPAAAVARQTAAVTNSLPSSAPSPHANTAFFSADLPDNAEMQTKLQEYGFTQLQALN